MSPERHSPHFALRPLSLLLALGLGTPSIAATTEAAATPAAPVRLAQAPVVSPTADGGLSPALGVVNIQVLRANRRETPLADGLAHTYVHQPMLAHWNGRFWLEFLSGPVHEHEAPCVTSLMSSADGRHWDKPVTAFPSITFPDGSQSVAHQRMGFFTAKSGRFYVLSFYGRLPTPNDGTGMGRAIREVNRDGSLGPIHFIRLNEDKGWTAAKAPYPLYDTSADAGFVADCRELLATRRMTLQWWEEERRGAPHFTVLGKAFNAYHRKDGALVSLFKDGLCALSHDEGETWTTKVAVPNMPPNTSKYWGQRTSDGRYALVFNPTLKLRHPLAIATGDDGSLFGGLATVHAELPDQRYGGDYKNLGPQYVRGIDEGNGTPPDGALWLAYSVNKEDLWLARVPVPVRLAETTPVDEDFQATQPGALPDGWNLYSPQWAPITVVETGSGAGRALELRDEEPVDYAHAIRLFPASAHLAATLKVMPRQLDGRLDVELHGPAGERPVQLRFDTDGHLWANHQGQWQDAGKYEKDRWHELSLRITKADQAELLVDGKSVLKRALYFTETCGLLTRLSLRTGAHRPRGEGGRDLPGTDQRAPAASFLVDDVKLTPLP